jgi:hypothetical protein
MIFFWNKDEKNLLRQLLNIFWKSNFRRNWAGKIKVKKLSFLLLIALSGNKKGNLSIAFVIILLNV